MSGERGGSTGWYGTRWGRRFYWGILVATLVGVALSTVGTALSMRIPPAIFLFGFLGATVYVFTSFAQQFDENDQYRLKILSRTVAVLPLAAGVYLLALAFPGIDGELTVLAADASGDGATQTDRLVAGLAFLAGIYVSTTLKALGGLAERLLGVSPGQRDSDGAETAAGPGEGEERGGGDSNESGGEGDDGTADSDTVD